MFRLSYKIQPHFAKLLINYVKFVCIRTIESIFVVFTKKLI